MKKNNVSRKKTLEEVKKAYNKFQINMGKIKREQRNILEKILKRKDKNKMEEVRSKIKSL